MSFLDSNLSVCKLPTSTVDGCHIERQEHCFDHSDAFSCEKIMKHREMKDTLFYVFLFFSWYVFGESLVSLVINEYTPLPAVEKSNITKYT
jgi:hypothetical protein